MFYNQHGEKVITMMTKTIATAAILVMAVGVSAEATAPPPGGEQEAALAEALAELHALGLQVEVLPAAAPTGALAAANAEEPAVTAAAAAQTLRERFNQALRTLGSSIATDIQNQIEQGVRRACQLSTDSGIELFSVSLSVGIVTATFRPTPGLCAALGEPD